MPLNPEYESAFEQDEAKRRRDAERQHAHAEKIRAESADLTRDRSRDGCLDRVTASPPIQAEYRNGQLALSMTPPVAQAQPAQEAVDPFADLRVYDLDGVTILRAGNVITLPVDEDDPPTTAAFAIYKIDWCDTSSGSPVNRQRYAFLSDFIG